MKLLFLISGWRVPSSRFRILQYIPHLQQAGHQCQVAASRPPKYRGWRLLGNRLSDVPRAAFRVYDWGRSLWSRPDVVIVERELLSSQFLFLERLFRRTAPTLVLDVDDALFLLHPRKFETLASCCDGIIAGSRLLQEQIALHNPDTTVIPTALDLSRYTPRPVSPDSPRPPVIGWTGSASNYMYLRPAIDALREVGREHAFELLLIAERPPTLQEIDLAGLAVRFQPWCEATEIPDLQRIDVGLAPLPDDPWTRHKCGLKLLQYMAVGVPSVASPVGVHQEIVRHGVNGHLADASDEWASVLRRLLKDQELRQAVGAAGRRTVEEQYSIQSTLPRLQQALTEWANRRSNR